MKNAKTPSICVWSPQERKGGTPTMTSSDVWVMVMLENGVSRGSLSLSDAFELGSTSEVPHVGLVLTGIKPLGERLTATDGAQWEHRPVLSAPALWREADVHVWTVCGGEVHEGSAAGRTLCWELYRLRHMTRRWHTTRLLARRNGLRSMFHQDKTNARSDSGCALSHTIFLKVTSCFASETVVRKYLANKKISLMMRLSSDCCSALDVEAAS